QERHLSQIPTPALSPLPMTQYTGFQPTSFAPASPPAGTSLALPPRDLSEVPTPALSPLPMTQYRDPYQYQPMSPEVQSPQVVGSPTPFTANPFSGSPIDNASTTPSPSTRSASVEQAASVASSRTSYEPHDDSFLF